MKIKTVEPVRLRNDSIIDIGELLNLRFRRLKTLLSVSIEYMKLNVMTLGHHIIIILGP